MNNPTIADIYAGNEKIHEKLKATLESLTEEQASSLPDGEKWTISQIVEHLSIVDEGMSKICSKLLSKAQSDGKISDGTVKISPGFVEKGAEIAVMKLEAPERVHPSAGASKFLHPFLGDISAVEWLTLVGRHKARHLRQIENLLEKIGQ